MAALQAVGEGAMIVDLRSDDERRREGLIPGSVHIPRSVLEWRLDPDSGYANPYVRPGQRVIVFCAHGFSSSFAAATLRDLGWWTATDIVGGYEGWKAAGLPTREVRADDEAADGRLPGMGPPAQARSVEARVDRWSEDASDSRTKGGV
jgi:rhodanese-related sulfurtransferase